MLDRSIIYDDYMFHQVIIDRILQVQQFLPIAEEAKSGFGGKEDTHKNTLKALKFPYKQSTQLNALNGSVFEK